MLEVVDIDIYEDCDFCGEVKELKYKIASDYSYELCEDCRLELLYKLVRVKKTYFNGRLCGRLRLKRRFYAK